MKLQLVKMKDRSGGYISTLDNNGKSLVCKPVSSSEIDDMVTSIDGNSHFFIQQIDAEDAHTWLISESI